MVAMDQSMEYVTSAVNVQTMTCALLAKVMGSTWSTPWLQSRVQEIVFTILEQCAMAAEVPSMAPVTSVPHAQTTTSAGYASAMDITQSIVCELYQTTPLRSVSHCYLDAFIFIFKLQKQMTS